MFKYVRENIETTLFRTTERLRGSQDFSYAAIAAVNAL